MARVVKNVDDTPRRRAPALTPEDREQQLIAKAINLVERQIDEGTASSQILTHYLKLATSKNRLEEEKLRTETELLKIKGENIEAQKNSENIAKEALEAMRAYSGGGNRGDY